MIRLRKGKGGIVNSHVILSGTSFPSMHRWRITFWIRFVKYHATFPNKERGGFYFATVAIPFLSASNFRDFLELLQFCFPPCETTIIHIPPSTKLKTQCSAIGVPLRQKDEWIINRKRNQQENNKSIRFVLLLLLLSMSSQSLIR